MHDHSAQEPTSLGMNIVRDGKTVTNRTKQCLGLVIRPGLIEVKRLKIPELRKKIGMFESFAIPKQERRALAQTPEFLEQIELFVQRP